MQKTVQVVIEISEEHFKKICANKEDAVIAHDTCRRIANGTVLPKHGRLIDADAMTKDFDTFKESIVINRLEDGTIVGMVCVAPTILEARRGE